MSIAAYLVLALAIGITAMIHLRNCAAATSVKLARGLAVAFILAAIYVLLYLLGISLGDILRIEGKESADLFARANAFIFLGLAVFVALRLIAPYLRRKPKPAVFDLRTWTSVLALSVATGINVLLLGIGMGFSSPLAGHTHLAIWPLFGFTFLLGYLGIMFGRQKVTMRPRRWMIVAGIFILGTAIAAVINA